MREPPPITIGLPVYNGANYISDAIRSLSQQTFTDFELIVSDNASTDATADLVNEATKDDDRVRYFRQPVNCGAPANYNFTLDRAEGEFFMWHAHDDLRAPEYLERTYTVLKSCTDASVAFSQGQWIGPNGELGDVKPSYPDLASLSRHRRLRAAIHHGPDLIFGLTRRSMLASTNGHGSFVGGDRSVVVELAMLGRFIEIPEVLWFNRRHPDQYTQMGPDRRRLIAWWKPEQADKIVFPRWRGLAGYIKAVGKYPLSPAERVLCLGSIGQSLFDNRMYLVKLLLRDALNGVADGGRRAWLRQGWFD
jgi:glycosyltransferase involved in cell wall biosynthesis